MRTHMLGLALSLAVFAAARGADAQEKPCNGDKYDTAVSWIEDAAQAAKKARTDGKLVMVVHLSGELNDAEKT